MTLKLGRILMGGLVMVSMIGGQTPLFANRLQARNVARDKVLPPYQVTVKGTALEYTIVPADYLVGPGDQFIVSVLSSEPYLELATVTPTGTIVLPAIGALSVVGLSAEDASRRVLAYIKEIFPTSEATCALYGIRQIRVSVSGAVKRPGFHEVTPLSRLTDLLDAAGGLQPRAALHRIRLVYDSEEERILDLTSYYHQGDLLQNPYLKGGDRIIVPYGDVTKDLVLVRGLGTGTTYHAMGSGETLASFMERIVHGEIADLGSVTLERRQGNERPEQLLIPAERYSSITLQPGDVLYINTHAEITVVGEVRRPGQLAYQPGLTAEDYMVLAGGVTSNGSPRKMMIIRLGGQTLQGGDTEVQAGDTIYVPRSFTSVFLGQLGMIQAALTFLNIYLAYLAAKGG